MKELQNAPRTTCISTDAGHFSFLSYVGEADGQFCFRRISAADAADARCIDYDVFDETGGSRMEYTDDEFRAVTGKDGPADRYEGVILRYGTLLVVPDSDMAAAPLASLRKITGAFRGTIADEFRNMYIAERLIDIEDDIAIYYRAADLVDGILRPLGFASVPAGCTQKAARKAVEKSILNAYGEDKGKKMLSETGQERILVMTVPPFEMEVMHLVGHWGSLYEFAAIDPRTCEMCLKLDGRFTSVRLRADAACRIGFDRGYMEKEGFLILMQRNAQNPAVVKSGYRFTKDMCRFAGYGEKTADGVSILRDVMTLRGLAAQGSVFHITAQEVARGSRITFCTGLKTTKRNTVPADFVSLFTDVERELKKRSFVLSRWRKDGPSYSVSFVLADRTGIPVRVSAGRYADVTAGAELQFSYESSSANRLCGVFYRGDSVFFCGNNASRAGLGGYSAVYTQRKNGGTDPGVALANGFFYGTPDGKGDITTPSPYRYLMHQAGFTGGTSVFDRLASAAPAAETEEAFAAVEGRSAADRPYRIVARLGRCQSVAVQRTEGWSRLDTVMLLADSYGNRSAELYRMNTSMECIGEIIA